MRPDESQDVLGLVMRVFDEFVAPDFTEEGVAEFAVSARRFLSGNEAGHAVTVAESDGELVGMIDVRDGSHVCLFFVERTAQRSGIGSGLLDAAVERALVQNPELKALTVNSGPSAVSAYRSFGFAATAAESEINGIRFVPMSLSLSARG